MTLWMLWSIAASTLVAAAAAALDGAASYVGLPRRLVWVAAISTTLVAPLVLGLRSTPTAKTSTAARETGALATASSKFGAVATRKVRRVVQTAVSDSPRAQYGSVRPGWHDAIAALPIAVARADAWVVRAWIAASAILLAVFVAAVSWLGVRRSQWKTVETEIGRVLLAPDVGPAVVGFLRPRIVLPSWALSVEARMRGLLLQHELEHLRAGDSRILVAAEFVLVLFPWNAPVWWMVRRLRLATEMDCDARVLRTTGSAYEYAWMLLGVGERYSGGFPLGASLVEPRSSLEARIDAMTAVRRRRSVAATAPLFMVAAIALVTAAWTPRADPLRLTRTSARRILGSSNEAVARVHQSPMRVRVVTPSGTTLGTKESAVAPRIGVVSAGPKPLPPFPAPVYPEQLRLARVEGYVLLKVRTDARGTPDTASIEIVESTNDLFTAAVRSRLRGWRFNSAGQIRLAFVFTTTETESGGRGGEASPMSLDPITGEASARNHYFPFLVKSWVTPPETVRDTSPEDSVLSAVGYLQRKQDGQRQQRLAQEGIVPRKDADAAGFFIDGQMIDRQASSFSQLLRMLPGFRISPSGDGRTSVIEDARNPTDGCVNTFIDGSLWLATAPGDIDAHVRPADLLAIEAYDRSGTPSQFTPRGRPDCATVVVWMRSKARTDRGPTLIHDDALYERVDGLVQALDSAIKVGSVRKP